MGGHVERIHEGEMHRNFWPKSLNGRSCLGIIETGCECRSLFNAFKEELRIVKCRDFVNTEMNLKIPPTSAISL
jgi:hypothetical protein